MISIDKKTLKISKDNYYQTKNPKTQILIGFSLRKEDYHIKRLKNKDLGNAKSWNTFTITREGKIFQHFPDENHSNYLNIKKVDIQIISIVLENMGVLNKDGGEFYNWLNERCDYKVETKKWFGLDYWEDIPEKQFESLVDLLIYLTDKHNISKKTIGFQSYNENTINFKGIVFAANYKENTLNMNPVLNHKRIDEILNSNQN